MYRVMIVDDETAIRSLLKKTINWEEMDLSVEGEAASGIEAINIIDEVRPDILFVDIRMPFMNGIEFAGLAIKRYPKLKIIILTAYEDFNYAKDCIGIGVSNYLLKPIVRTEINEALLKIKGQLDLERKLDWERNQTEPDEAIDELYGYSFAIEEIVKYIKDNYEDKTLNLTSVSKIFGFNSSYLSRKFKEETGQGLSAYLTEIRMEKAKELAAKGSIMYMTAERVGIPDPNYFGKLFKKNVGMTYSAYSSDEES